MKHKTPAFMSNHQFANRFVNELPGESTMNNTPRQVKQICWSRTLPTQVKAATLIAYSTDAATLLDLSAADTQSNIFAEVFSGNKILPGMHPYASRYGGHQFGNWAGQLGDGRAINLAEIINRAGEHWEIQLKGAGPTPYSRHADGRAVLRSSIREFLCSEAMYYLGIPTTRALSLITTGEMVMRDMFYNGDAKLEPGAIVCRVAPSFIRFGNFEILAASGEDDLLEKLIDFTISRDFPELGGEKHSQRANWFKIICERTAHLIIEWLRVGFVHGVMNTDNMSILGLTIDYGPYGWLDNYDPNWTPNTTDAQQHRYAYGAQANIAYWNLYCLANALTKIIPPEQLQDGLAHYQSFFATSYQEMIFAKFGFNQQPEPKGILLAEDAYELMEKSAVDMTCFFRQLAEIDINAPDFNLLADAFYQDNLKIAYAEKWQDWLLRYGSYCLSNPANYNRKLSMNAVNPRYILRNYLTQEAIELAYAGDYSRIQQLMAVIKKPYDENNDYQKFAAKRPEWALNRAGCSMLSCSS
jgi:uncharacterized protein YdiU (UPF0061 family)